jgi:hypothetical protein
LIEIVERLMAKRPADRFQDASEVLEALSGVEVDASAANWQELLKQLRHSGPGAFSASSLSAGQLAATRRLEVLMRGPRWADRVRFGFWLTAAMLLMVVSGFVLAKSLAPPDRLQRAREQTVTLPRKDSIADQYMYAYFADSEDGWYAVIDYYKDSTAPPEVLESVYVQWAKERLAEFYLERRQWAEALKIYNEFSQFPLMRKERTISNYGTAICRHYQGDSDLVNRLRSEKTPDSITKTLKAHWDSILSELDKQTD